MSNRRIYNICIHIVLLLYYIKCACVSDSMLASIRTHTHSDAASDRDEALAADDGCVPIYIFINAM